jgi:hypothetical protein
MRPVTPTRKLPSLWLFALVPMLLASTALAQSVITAPPASMTVESTNANDSTSGIAQLSPNVSDNSISFAQPQANPSSPVGGITTTPIQTCFAGTTTNSQTGHCPTGYVTTSGSSTFTQTQTVTTTCPLGPYGASSTVISAWSPASNEIECPNP